MNSPFQQHFDSNYVPTILETSQIKDYLQESTEELQQIDVEISRLQQQRSKVQELSVKLRALISPARRIDRDILAEIFLACLPSDRNPCMSSSEAPVLLTHICSSWRSIAHSTPRLWASVHISFPWICWPEYLFPWLTPNMRSERASMVQNVVNKREAAAKMWLDRSGNLPLSISIYHCLSYSDVDTGYILDVENEFPEIFQQQYQQFFRSIVSYCERWHTLDVCLPRGALEYLFERGSIAERLKSLMNLHITSITGYEYQSSDQEMVWLWPTASNLLASQVTSATLFGIIPNDSKELLWRHLTDLNVEFGRNRSGSEATSFDEARKVISHCTVLKTLKLTILSTETQSLDTTSNTPFHEERQRVNILNHLEKMSLVIPPSNRTRQLARSFFLPSIKHLDFKITVSTTGCYALARDCISAILHDCKNGVSLRLYLPIWLEGPVQDLSISASS